MGKLERAASRQPQSRYEEAASDAQPVIMPTIAEYTALVSEIEAGRYPRGLDRKEAIDGLIVEICVAPWKEPQERQQAQSLAARLSVVARQQGNILTVDQDQGANEPKK